MYQLFHVMHVPMLCLHCISQFEIPFFCNSLVNQKMEEILKKFDTSHQQIYSREEYAEMAKYLSDLAEG
jgi:hypothetical protein